MYNIVIVMKYLKENILCILGDKEFQMIIYIVIVILKVLLSNIMLGIINFQLFKKIDNLKLMKEFKMTLQKKLEVLKYHHMILKEDKHNLHLKNNQK